MIKRALLGILGVVVGLGFGMALNMGLILVNMTLHGPPEGLSWEDPAQVEAFMASMPVLGFLIVLLAHSGQAFLGSLVGTLISGRRSIVVGMIIGVLTLLGCVMMLTTARGPVWFAALDVLLPLPAAYLAARLVMRKGADPEAESTVAS